MDPDLGRFRVVWAAAGTGTAVFPVPPATLRTLANAVVMPVTEDPAVTEASLSDGQGGATGYAPTGVSPQNAGA